MSLIHKALQKGGGSDVPQGPPDPEEEIVGKGGGFLSAQFTPRTVILLVLALGALGFMLYKTFFAKPRAALPVAALAPAAPGQAQVPTPATPTPAGTAPAATTRAPSTTVGTGRSGEAPPDLPPDVVELIDAGKRHFAAGQWDASLEQFTAAAEKAPDAALIWNNIGLVQKRRQQVPEAEKAYTKAVELKPDYPEALNNLGVLKAAQGDALSATLYLKKALLIDPTYADAHFNLAVILEQEGNWKSAVAAYKSFLQFTASVDKALLEQVERRIEELSE